MPCSRSFQSLFCMEKFPDQATPWYESDDGKELEVLQVCTTEGLLISGKPWYNLGVGQMMKIVHLRGVWQPPCRKGTREVHVGVLALSD